LHSYGVVAAGTQGYFQDVPILVTKEEASSLTLMDGPLGKIPFELGVDYDLITHSGSNSFVAPVVIAGFGYVRPDKGRDDYGELDVQGKIVVLLRGLPESPYDFGSDYSRNVTLKWAKEKGAKAVMWHASEFPLNGAAIRKDVRDENMPMLYIGDRILRLLLDGSGYSQKSYKEKIKSDPIPLETGKEMWISTRVRDISSGKGRNVIGIVYGSDPVLKNEVIVVGGHLDHCGVNSKGVVFNGADDNASGSGVVMELARSVAQGDPLKRSVLFMLFTAEEDGLIGSSYFAEHPTVPFGNIACMMNFDMVGQGNGNVGMEGGELLGRCWTEYRTSLTDHDKDIIEFYRQDGGGSSDHASFVEAGAPAVNFHSAGSHPFYHQYTDDAESIDDSVLYAVGTQAEKLLRFLGDYPSPLACRSDSVRMLASIATTIDFDGFFLDQNGTLPKFSVVNAAWLPHDGAIPALELVRRTSEANYICNDRDIASSGLKDAIDASMNQRDGIFFAINEATLANKTAAEAQMLARQNLSLVNLTPGNTKGGKMPEQIEKTLRDDEVYAVVPLDFSTPDRVKTWKKQAIVRTRIAEFSNLAPAIRDSLLVSDALIVIEMDEPASIDQYKLIYPARERLVHLNFGTSYDDLRETEQKAAIRTMYQAGMTRDDILLLTGGNLRRFLGLY
jgi:hypothetical protein